MRMRHLPPVHSPLSLAALVGAAGETIRWSADPRERLCRLLRRQYGSQHVRLFGAGTEALLVAMQAAHSVAGGTGSVALPAYTCFDVGAAAVAADLPIVLYDIEPSTLTPDYESLEARLREGARVVVVAPLYGIPVDWEVVEHCLSPFAAIAVEDAAQGHGAEWRGRPLGSLGKLSILSFGRGKGWTCGRGGALLAADAGPASNSHEPRRSSELRPLAVAAAQWALARPTLYSLPSAVPWLRLGETYYREARPPSDLPRSAAALLERTLKASLLEAEARRKSGEILVEGIDFAAKVRPVRSPRGGRPGYLRLPVRLSRGLAGFPNPESALRLGIAAGYPSTLADLAPVRARMSGPPIRLPGAEELVRELVTLPTHSWIRRGERERLLRTVNTYPG